MSTAQVTPATAKDALDLTNIRSGPRHLAGISFKTGCLSPWSLNRRTPQFDQLFFLNSGKNSTRYLDAKKVSTRSKVGSEKSGSIERKTEECFSDSLLRVSKKFIEAHEKVLKNGTWDFQGLVY